MTRNIFSRRESGMHGHCYGAESQQKRPLTARKAGLNFRPPLLPGMTDHSPATSWGLQWVQCSAAVWLINRHGAEDAAMPLSLSLNPRSFSALRKTTFVGIWQPYGWIKI